MSNAYSYSLPGIRKIGYLKADALQVDQVFSAIACIPVAVFNDVKCVSVFGQCECSRKRSLVNRAIQEEASLSFNSTQNIPVKDIAFIIIDVNGLLWIIGSAKPPFPVVEAEKLSGAPDGDSAVTKYSVTHKALRSLIPLYVTD